MPHLVRTRATGAALFRRQRENVEGDDRAGAQVQGSWGEAL